MTAFWKERTGRERLLIMVLGLVSATYLLLAAIWQPLQNHRATLTDDIARYARATTVLSTIPGGYVAPIANTTPLPGIITDTAATYQLTIRRLQPSASTADITLDDARFEAVLLWIDALERDHGLRIVTLTMTRRPEPGLIAANLIVGR